MGESEVFHGNLYPTAEDAARESARRLCGWSFYKSAGDSLERIVEDFLAREYADDLKDRLRSGLRIERGVAGVEFASGRLGFRVARRTRQAEGHAGGVTSYAERWQPSASRGKRISLQVAALVQVLGPGEEPEARPLLLGGQPIPFSAVRFERKGGKWILREVSGGG
jgi:hypothetical protein